jgi:hypothetical protein
MKKAATTNKIAKKADSKQSKVVKLPKPNQNQIIKKGIWWS